MASLEIVATFIVVIALFVLKYAQYGRMVKELSIPGPKPTPFIGNIFEINHSIWTRGLEWLNTYGDFVQIFMMSKRFVLIGNAEAAKLAYNDEIFYKVLSSEEILGKTGIVNLDGEEWQRMRRICGHAFTLNHFRAFCDPIHLCIDNLFSRLSANLSSNKSIHPIALDELMTNFTLDVIGQTMFSLDFQAVNSGNVPFSTQLNIYMNEAQKQRVNPLYRFLHPTSGFKRARTGKFLQNFVYDIIAQRIEARKTGDHGSKDLLDLLLDAKDGSGNGLSPVEVKDQALTFLFAGHETTAHTLTFVLACLASHPHAAARVQDELRQVFGESDRRAEYEDTSKLPYMTAVIKETLRMYPVAAELYRRANQDTELGGYKIPKGTDVIIGTMALHYNPSLWDNPTQFRPERFLTMESDDKATAAISLVAHSPFGIGRRSCIGQAFAMLEMRLVLASVLRNFDFAHVPMAPLETIQTLTLKPKSLRMTVWPRA